jgi:hypothetical protein
MFASLMIASLKVSASQLTLPVGYVVQVGQRRTGRKPQQIRLAKLSNLRRKNRGLGRAERVPTLCFFVKLSKSCSSRDHAHTVPLED